MSTAHAHWIQPDGSHWVSAWLSCARAPVRSVLLSGAAASCDLPQPIVPRFRLSQDDTFVYVHVHVPYVRVSAMEFCVEGDGVHFSFFCTPYLLKLCLPGPVVDDDRAVASYDPDEAHGMLHVQLPKVRVVGVCVRPNPVARACAFLPGIQRCPHCTHAPCYRNPITAVMATQSLGVTCAHSFGPCLRTSPPPHPPPTHDRPGSQLTPGTAFEGLDLLTALMQPRRRTRGPGGPRPLAGPLIEELPDGSGGGGGAGDGHSAPHTGAGATRPSGTAAEVSGPRGASGHAGAALKAVRQPAGCTDSHNGGSGGGDDDDGNDDDDDGGDDGDDGHNLEDLPGLRLRSAADLEGALGPEVTYGFAGGKARVFRALEEYACILENPDPDGLPPAARRPARLLAEDAQFDLARFLADELDGETVRRCLALCGVVWCGVVWHCVVWRCAALCGVVRRCAALCGVVRRCAALCGVVRRVLA
jgi:hypothetical protein